MRETASLRIQWRKSDVCSLDICKVVLQVQPGDDLILLYHEVTKDITSFECKFFISGFIA